MKAILTITGGNKDPKNFCREIELTPDEFDYLKSATLTINANGGQQFTSVYVKEV